jgi:transcriptional regulator with XRE-family HTH domain
MHPIKTYSQKNNIKIKDIAKKAGITPVYLSQIIMGYRKPSPNVAKKIANSCENKVSLLAILYYIKTQKTTRK